MNSGAGAGRMVSGPLAAANDQARRIIGLPRGMQHLARLAVDLGPLDPSGERLAFVDADPHRAAADHLAPARIQIAQHDRIPGAEPDDPAGLHIVHEFDAGRRAGDLLDDRRGGLRRS